MDAVDLDLGLNRTDAVGSDMGLWQPNRYIFLDLLFENRTDVVGLDFGLLELEGCSWPGPWIVGTRRMLCCRTSDCGNLMDAAGLVCETGRIQLAWT